MDINNALFAIALGAGGYLVANFWMVPLLDYRRAKKKVAVNVVYYANVLGNRELNEFGDERRREGASEVRRNASELVGCYSQLPWWYRRYLQIVSEEPKTASKGLIGMSNANDQVLASRFANEVAVALRMGNLESGD